MTQLQSDAGAARALGEAPRVTLGRESTYQHVPEVLLEESYRFLGDEPIDTERYHSREFHRREVEKVWSKTWQMACREDELPNVGDHVVYDIAHYSLIIMRSAPDRIQAFHNSCLHRGTQLREEAGCVKQIRCPFHGWTWNVDGSLKKLSSAWDLPHLTPEKLALPEAKVETWGGFVFINIDLDAGPLLDYMENLPEQFRDWPMNKRFKAAHVAKVISCNWKVLLEAFIESYHVAFTHPAMVFYFADEATQYDVYGDHVNRMISCGAQVTSHVPIDADETTIAKAMAVDFGIGDPDSIEVPEGKTARDVVSETLKAQISSMTGADLSAASNSEMLDGIEYSLFPNLALWAGHGLPMAYRFRPNGDDPDSSIFDVMMFAVMPEGVDPPPPAPVHWLGPDESWTNAPELGVLGPAYNQDTNNLPRIQRGLKASKTGVVNLTNYQEVRIRHFHQTLDKYLNT